MNRCLLICATVFGLAAAEATPPEAAPAQTPPDRPMVAPIPLPADLSPPGDVPHRTHDSTKATESKDSAGVSVDRWALHFARAEERDGEVVVVFREEGYKQVEAVFESEGREFQFTKVVPRGKFHDSPFPIDGTRVRAMAADRMPISPQALLARLNRKSVVCLIVLRNAPKDDNELLDMVLPELPDDMVVIVLNGAEPGVGADSR